MNTEASKWTPFLALVVCAGGFLAQTDEDVGPSGPRAQTRAGFPLAGESLVGEQAGSSTLDVKPIETSRYRAAKAAPAPPTNEQPDLTAWSGGRVRDPRHDPVPVELIIVLEDKGDIADWQEQIVRGTLRPHPEADIAKDRFRVPVRDDAASHLAILAGGRWWLIESVQPSCDSLVIEVPLETKTPAPILNIPTGSRSFFTTIPIGSDSPSVDPLRYETNRDVRAGIRIAVHMAWPDETTDSTRPPNPGDLTNSWISAIDFHNIEGLNSVPEGSGAAEAAHIDARPPTCLRIRAFDEGTGEEFYVWDLIPR